MFERHPILHTDSIDQVVERIAATGTRLGVARGARMAAGGATINGRWLKRLSFSHLRYGFAADIAFTDEAETYNLSLPLAGVVGVDSRSERALIEPGMAALMSPGEPLAFKLPANLQRIVVRYSAAAIAHQLEILGGGATRLRFMPVIGGGPGRGGALLRQIRVAAARLHEEPGGAEGASFWDEIESAMLTSLLVLVPHDCWEGTEKRPPAAPSRGSLRRAIDYIRANACHGITVEELVAVAGVSGRSLFRHFRSATGFGPMAYLRRVRLEATRDDLIAGRAQSVAEAARRWGFTELGRFAGEYRRAFGERPSDTLRRAH